MLPFGVNKTEAQGGVEITMNRRKFLRSIAAAITSRSLFANTRTPSERLAEAARAQLGVTHTYDPGWTLLKYPGGDVDRSKGVCADVVIRAGRDGLGLDLQKLVHEDMVAHFDAVTRQIVIRAQNKPAF